MESGYVAGPVVGWVGMEGRCWWSKLLSGDLESWIWNVELAHHLPGVAQAVCDGEFRAWKNPADPAPVLSLP